jgi:hypothetical protein
MKKKTGSSRSPWQTVGGDLFRPDLFLVGMVSLLAATLQAASPRVVITPTAGFTITWDGNNGGFSNPEAGAGPSNNVALSSNGTVPFTSSDLGPALSIPFHRAINLNDGLYGNSHSWISAGGLDGTSDPNPFAGLGFAASVNVSSIAWSRDNGDTTEGGCAGGTCMDRCLGLYTLQYTTVTTPDATTAETGDAGTGWATIGTVQYLAGTDDANFTTHLRHRFEVAQGGNPIAATGLRLKVPDAMADIDEIEVNPIPDPIPPISTFIEIAPAAGFAIAWDRNAGLFSTASSPAPAPANDASVTRGAVAFGSSELNLGVHFVHNVNDGLYGNAHSWIPDFLGNPPDAAPFIGIKFAQRTLLHSIAWGRDNGDVAGDCCGGTLTDRALGLYTLQVTTMADPGASTPEACGPYPSLGWVTIGTISYKADDARYFNSYLRHRFDLTQNGLAIAATAIRLKVPNNQSDIDEIEVNGNLAIEQNAVRITNAAGITIGWDGNDGEFNNPAVGAAPPDNRALASHGTVPFTSSDLGPAIGVPFHRAVNLNDGLYGNGNSWIPNFVGGDPNPFAGLSFGGTVAITNIAWGRDNGNIAGDCCGGTLTDRCLGTFHLQYTTVAAPDATTADTGDAATGWQDLGSITYAVAVPSLFTPYLRHRFDLTTGGQPVEATGLRIKVPDSTMDIDEIEINTAAGAAVPPVVLTPSAGYTIAWDGNDGQFNNPALGATPPPNRALAAAGTTPFTSSDLGPVLSISWHVAANLNDGLYGNNKSWISANGLGGATDPDPFAGLNFNGTVLITNIAWGRDNGNTVADDCGGTCTDRCLGTFRLQHTTSPVVDSSTPETGDATTGWADIGTVEYRQANPPVFTPYLRHRFQVSAGGAPIEATGLRIKVPDGQTAIDEIEVNTLIGPLLSISCANSEAVITWLGEGVLEYATSVNGPWTCIAGAVSGHRESVTTGPLRLYRVRR